MTDKDYLQLSWVKAFIYVIVFRSILSHVHLKHKQTIWWEKYSALYSGHNNNNNNHYNDNYYYLI